MDWLLEAALRRRQQEQMAKKPSEHPDDSHLTGKRNGWQPYRKRKVREGNVFHRETKPVQSQMEITWPEHHAA